MKNSIDRKTITLDDVDSLKTVIYIEEDETECIENDWFYYVVDESDTDYLIVEADKIDLYIMHQGAREEYLYSEFIPKSEMTEIEL